MVKYLNFHNSSFVLRYFLNANGKATVWQAPCFRIEYNLIMIIPTHKRHKSSFKHSKIICVFISWQVIVIVQKNF
jgi:hypothetical protein